MTSIKVKQVKSKEQIVPVRIVPGKDSVMEALRAYPESDFKNVIKAAKYYRRADKTLNSAE